MVDGEFFDMLTHAALSMMGAAYIFAFSSEYAFEAVEITTDYRCVHA